MDGELYLTLQTGIMLFASWTSVAVYNILVSRRIEPEKAFKLTFLYSFLSIHFFLSTYIVRDMPIALFFTLLIYFSFKPLSTKTLILMGSLVVLISSLRKASGIFAILYILLFLILSIKKGSIKKRITAVCILLILMAATLISVGKVQSLYQQKMKEYAAYEKADKGGASTVYSLNALPPGISHLAKAAYNQMMPIPSWSAMIHRETRPESYTVMNFPTITGTLFQYCVWGIILLGMLNINVLGKLWKEKALIYHFTIAIAFLMLNTYSMGHRRILGVYPLFFLISIFILNQYNKKDRYIMIMIPLFVFILAQILSLTSIK
jgi:hypothetical protein